MNLIRSAVVLWFLMTTLSAVFAHGQNACVQLFVQSQNETAQNRKRLDDQQDLNRRQDVSWSLPEERLESLKAILKMTILPEKNRLLTYTHGNKVQLVRESLIKVNGQDKVKVDKIPLDESLPGLVIDAGLESGRKFLDVLLNQMANTKSEVVGTFIFIDVNNLGYVNKNFFNKSKDGDALIRGAAQVFQKMCADQGLLFRMGGDEFGLVMPPMSPKDLVKFQETLIKNLRLEVHKIFVNETKTRAENLRVAQKSFQLGLDGHTGQVDRQTLNYEIEAFKKYATYSQEGLSIGSVYLGSGDAQVIQNQAENLATQMKVAVKSALHQDISKYTDQKYDYSGPPRLAYRYVFPEIDQSMYNPISISDSSLVKYDKPRVQSIRGSVVKRLGPVSLVHYYTEDGQTETHIEYYGDSHKNKLESVPQRLAKVEKADIHSHSGFIDAKSKESQRLLHFFVNEYVESRGVIWINLLNLGKLNYFVQKTATGDRMIKRYAEIIQETMRNSDIPVKLVGSEFAILCNQAGKIKLEKIKQRLLDQIDNDPVVHQIYQEQIDYLQEQLKRTDDEIKKAHLLLKINETIELKNNHKVTIQTYSLEGSSEKTFESLIQDLKSLVL